MSVGNGLKFIYNIYFLIFWNFNKRKQEKKYTEPTKGLTITYYGSTIHRLMKAGHLK